MNTQENRTYTPADLADLLGVHPRTINRYLNDGAIPAVRLPGVRGQYLIPGSVYDAIRNMMDRANAEADAWARRLIESASAKPDEPEPTEDEPAPKASRPMQIEKVLGVPIGGGGVFDVGELFTRRDRLTEMVEDALRRGTK